MASIGSTGIASVKISASHFRQIAILVLLLLIVSNGELWQACAQAVPYARAFSKPKADVDKALAELGANTGQKLPIVDGFVATTDHPLDRYERAFYQFSIDELPGPSAGTVVRLTAKITAWYADRDPSKSGYQVLPSNGRLELDFLDRLSEKLGEKPVDSVLKSQVQSPAPKLDLTAGLYRSSTSGSRPSSTATGDPETATAGEEVAALHAKREAQEKRMRQLGTELESLKEIQRGQAHPPDLVAVKRNGTPVLAHPGETSSVLFMAAADDEFQFLDVKADWVHVQISGASRGYIRRSGLELPEFVAERFNSPNAATSEAFRVESENASMFPGDWEPLRGKSVEIFTIQPVSQSSKETGARAKLAFASSVLKEFSAKPAPTASAVEGVVIVFDSADGGMIGTTLQDLKQFAGGALSAADFWKHCYLDPPEAFKVSGKPSD
jgi:hypothetical protein